MTERREPKKSETLEVRLTHEAKLALMRKAQAEGRSASDVVRDCIGAYLVDQPKEARSMFITAWKPAAALGVAAVALFWSTLGAGPAFAGPDLKSVFESFDRNKDGAITFEEFRGGHSDNLVSVHSKVVGQNPGPIMIPLHGHPQLAAHGAKAPPNLLQGDFARQDKDGNGSVSYSEFEQFHRDLMRTAFSNVDADHNGSVEAEELAAVTAHMPANGAHTPFAELDRNQDGKLTEEEFFAAHP
jgi:Ca2+-binding EF-hand superfamily protein